MSEQSYERRRKPRAHPDATFIPTAEFHGLLMSRRALVRLDCHDGNVRGLLDLETDEKFLVKRKDLLRQ